MTAPLSPPLDAVPPPARPAPGALQGGLLALGTVIPQTLALVGIAYAPLAVLGLPLNPIWVLWSALAGALLMFLFTRGRGAIYGVRPGAALLYGSTLATCASLAPALKLNPQGVLALAAACMSLSALIIWLALRSGGTAFARYLPAPVGRGLSLGFGLTILWMQLRTVGGWFPAAQGWKPHVSAGGVATLMLLVVLVYLALAWRRKYPGKPYLLALLPVAVAGVAGLERVVTLPLGWLAVPAINSPKDLLPLYLPQAFSADVMSGAGWAVYWTALTVLAAQAMFVAFTFLVDAAGNAATLESLGGGSYDLNDELRASAATMAVLPWFGLIPASSMLTATRPVYETGVRDPATVRRANLVVAAGVVVLLALVWLGLKQLPMLFVVASLFVIGISLLDPALFERPGNGPGERELWWQTWLIGLVFLFTSGIFAMIAGFTVAVVQLVRGAEGTVIRSIHTLKDVRSRRWRGDEEEQLLRQAAGRVVIVTLQGTASFAVARRIREEITRIVQPSQMDVLLIDTQRVSHWDVTALEAFRRLADEFQRSKVEFVLSHASPEAGRALQDAVRLFGSTDRALEWAEGEVLRRGGFDAARQQGQRYGRPIELPLLAGMGDSARMELAACGRVLAVATGQPVFQAGDTDGSLLMLLAGQVSIQLGEGPEPLRVATFGPGMAFGEMAFLDGSPRSARATAVSTCMVFSLPRAAFAAWAQRHPHDAQLFLSGLTAQLAQRLRATTGQLIAVSA